MMGAAITPVWGREAPEVLEARARAPAFSLELTNLVPLMPAGRSAPFSNGGVPGLSRIYQRCSYGRYRHVVPSLLQYSSP